MFGTRLYLCFLVHVWHFFTLLAAKEELDSVPTETTMMHTSEYDEGLEKDANDPPFSSGTSFIDEKEMVDPVKQEYNPIQPFDKGTAPAKDTRQKPAMAFLGDHYAEKPLWARLNWIHTPLFVVPPILAIYSPHSEMGPGFKLRAGALGRWEGL